MVFNIFLSFGFAADNRNRMSFFALNAFVSGLLICPNEPVTTIFIFSVFLILQKSATIQKTEVTKSPFVVVKKNKIYYFAATASISSFHFFSSNWQQNTVRAGA